MAIVVAMMAGHHSAMACSRRLPSAMQATARAAHHPKRDQPWRIVNSRQRAITGKK